MRRARPAARAGALVLAGLALLAAPAPAYFEDVSSGGRHLALGRCGAVFADDVSAYYWNPAALSRLERWDGMSHYGKPHGAEGLNAYALALGTRVRDTGVALGWHRLAISDAYAEDLFALAVGREVARWRSAHALAVGAAVKLGRVGVQPYSVEMPEAEPLRFDYGSVSQVSFDVGVLWTTPWKIEVAWVGRDLNTPRYEFVAGSGGARVGFTHEITAAYRWNVESTILASWKHLPTEARSAVAGDPRSSTIDLGIEIWFYDVFALRSGFTNVASIPQYTVFGEDFGFTGGVGLKQKHWLIDAAVTTNRDLGASYSVSLRVPFGKAVGQ